jgi:DNA repair protein RecN (Recombination protein N)
MLMLATLALLRIRNLALVEELTWQIGAGFTAVTGETGSGKSIIVGALKLVLGDRAEKSLIRAGAESCSVEAVFEVGNRTALNAELLQHGIDACEDEQLIVKRVFTAAGANRQFINGSATTLAVLKSLGDGLVDLHGPHEHQSLLSKTRQLELLDAFAGGEQLRHTYGEQFRRWQQLVAEQRELSVSEATLEREIDLLRHQANEIQAAKLRSGEEEELVPRYAVASNRRRLLELSTEILQRLIEADDAVLARLRVIGKLLRDLERVDQGAAKMSQSHVEAITELEDLAGSLQRYAEGLEIEPAQLAALEQRVSLFETLKRKYGSSIHDVIAFGEQAAQRLQKIESRGAQLEQLGKEITTARGSVMETGKRLRELRRSAAPKLSRNVSTHLCDLGFKKSLFAVELSESSEPGSTGLDSVEFLFAPNPGEPERPLKAIASSGEISRVMLAVKSSLAAQDTIPLLVFDEIDVNVGGEIARAVGSMMKSLAKAHQVICITHLPQVAAHADGQFVVTKEFARNRTLSQIAPVEGKARVEEIARMLGGKGDSALAHARTLLGE